MGFTADILDFKMADILDFKMAAIEARGGGGGGVLT